MRRVVALTVAALVAGMLALTSCGGGGSLSVTARFTDVGDLTTDAPVMMDDIQVGKVTDIALDHDEALVTMAIDPDAHVPEQVTARVRRTSLLGERIVDLVIPEGLAQNAPLLHDGERIQNTIVRPDLEDLVKQGTAVIAPITASQVATLVNEGAEGFGTTGPQLRQLLDNFQKIVHGFSGETGTIQTVIESLNQLNGSLAPHAGAQAQSVANSARALDVLNEESGRLQTAIHALSRLAVGARGILDAHEDEMARFFSQMRTILAVLQSEQTSIDALLYWAPYHNRNTQMVEYKQFNQILQDFVICGFNDDPNDRARRCPHQP